MKRFALFVFVLVLTGVCCCAHRQHASPASEIEKSYAADLWERSALLTSFRLLLESRSPKQRPYRLSIVYRAPNRLRIDLLPPQGAYAFGVLNVVDRQYHYVDQERREISVGAVSRSTLLRYVGLDVDPWDLAPLLVQRLPSRFQDQQRQFVWEGAEAVNRVLRDRDSQSVVVFDSARGSVQEIALGSGSAIEVRAEYGGDSYDWLKISAPLQDQLLEFRVARVQLNADIPDRLFDPIRPQGYKLIDESRRGGGAS